MKKFGKKRVEFRFYEKPGKEPVLALRGDEWVRKYGSEIPNVHFHNLMEIGYCFNGEGYMVMQKNRLEYQAGNFTIIPQNILHDTHSEELSYWQYLFFDVDELILSAYPEQPEKAERILRSIWKDGQMYHRDTDHALSEMILAVFEQMERREAYYAETVRGLLLAIVLQLAMENEKQRPREIVPDYNKENRVVPALVYVNEHYHEMIRVEELAWRCHLSESHFRRIFLEEMNMAPVEYMNLVRVQAACDLMRRIGIWKRLQ